MEGNGRKGSQIPHLYNICWYDSVMGALCLSMYLCGKPNSEHTSLPLNVPACQAAVELEVASCKAVGKE